MNEIVTIGSGQDWRAPQWLLNNTPSHPVDASRQEVLEAVGRARRCLEVCSEEELLILLREALSIFEVPENWEAVQGKIYVAALEDLPADLVRAGLQHVVRTYEYKFPKPASIRKPVEKELSDRKATVTRLESILKIGKFKEPERQPRTPEDIARVSEMVAKATAHLRTAADWERPKAVQEG